MSMEFKKHAKQPKKRTTLIEGKKISNFLLEEFGVYLKLSEKQEKFIKTCEESEIAFLRDFIRKYTGYTRNTEIMDKALKESKKYPEFEKILRKLLSA